MPTLLEKPAPSPAPLQPAELLRHRHRWERWRGVLSVLLIGLTVTLVFVLLVRHAWHAQGDWKIVAGIWAGGLFFTALGALFGWRSAPSSLLNTAQHMDQNFLAKNRLEAAATLHGSTTPLALAQREETAAYLQRAAPGVRPIRLLPWLVGGIMVLIAANLVTLAVWVVPVLMRPAALIPPPPPKPLPAAAITWQSPEQESKANPVEEVPTVAVVTSSSGLKNLSLEISVNGMLKKSVPLPATPFDKAGKNTLKTSLYMDEIGVEPFDVVSYYIRAERVTDQTVPETASPIQFIQVRPFRDDVSKDDGGDDDSGKNHALLIQLKLAELKSVKENFILAHTDLAATDPIRVKENSVVGKNQGDLAGKTDEVVQAFIQSGYPADMVDLLQQAEPPMKDASKKILALQNNDALPPQQKALGLIVQVEKYFHKFMADKGDDAPENNPDDPFKDKQQHELKKRMDAAAGKLEQLAKNQTKLANDLGHADSPDSSSSPAPNTTNAASPASNQSDSASPKNSLPETSGTNPGQDQKEGSKPDAQAADPFGLDADKGTPAERQARVLQGIETLLNSNNPLPPSVNDTLQAAQKEAAESVHQLDQANVADAREPAADAAQNLQRAVTEMNQIGEEQTKAAMLQTQQKLNDQASHLEDLAKSAPPDAQDRLAQMAQQVRDDQKALEDAADKQQEAGSAVGAQRLDHLDKAMDDKHVDQNLAALSKAPLDANTALAEADKLKALADQAAQDANAGKPSAQDLAKLVNALEASRANLARFAQPAVTANPSPDPQTGIAPGEKTGTEGGGKDDQGKDPGQSAKPGKGDLGHGQNASGAGSGGGGVGSPTAAALGYRDTLAGIKDQAEDAKAALPSTNTSDLLQSVDRAQEISRVTPTNASNVTAGYKIIAKPLDQLIVDLQQAITHAQREEVVKQPNLDDAPPAYRSAVSDYFETLSKNYHPDSADADAKKP